MRYDAPYEFTFSESSIPELLRICHVIQFYHMYFTGLIRPR